LGSTRPPNLIDNLRLLRQISRMPFHRDALAISFLLFTFVLTVWLGVSGPISWSIEGPITGHRILKLAERWQPLVAALVALVAATLAYRSAMARVNYDRKAAADLERKRTLGISIRLRYAVFVMHREIVINLAKIGDARITLEPRILRIQDIAVPSTDMLDEAWMNIHYFPREIIFDLGKVQTCMRNIRLYMGTDPDKKWSIQPSEDIPAQLLSIEIFSNELAEVTKEIGQRLQAFNRTLLQLYWVPAFRARNSFHCSMQLPRRPISFLSSGYRIRGPVNWFAN
jgi:hypothetical protein